MSGVQIRPAHAGDATGVATIMNPVIRETTISFKPRELSEAEIIAIIENAPAYFVAVDEGGGYLGFAYYNQFRGGAGYARTMEHSIMLAPEARGRGVGAALMNALESRAIQQKIGSLWAGVSADNSGGLAFHRRMGFEEVGRLPKVGYKFDQWLDLILMRKWLDPDGDAAETSD